jgi:2-methylcitrate dehydratase PrpD
VNETRALVNFVSGTGYDDLPASVVERMKVYTLDVLAAGFIGSKLPWAEMVLQLAREQRGVEECSVFATAGRLTASQAALVNGVMVGGFESEHVGHTSHPAGTVTPGALAIAERDRASGRDFLLATALGYEVVCRIGDAQTGAVEMERGFHNPAANGPFSAAAAVGKLRRLDEQKLACAFGIAGSHCGGLTEYAWDGSMTKRLHLGRASQLGMESALLAEKGFTGPATILEGRFGYFNAFSPSPKMERLLDGLGEEWRLETLIIKAYPCHVTSQAIVAAVQGFKTQQPVDPARIEKIHLTAPPRLLQQRFLDASPNSEMGAQYSLPFTTAVAFYRDLNDPTQYDDSVLDDPGITRLAKAITWQESGGSHESLDAELQVSIGGQQHTIAAGPFVGSLQRPAQFADVESKFRRFSKHVLSEAQQDEIVAMVQQLDQLDDVSRLAAALRG